MSKFESKPKVKKALKKVPKHRIKEDFQRVYSKLKSINLVAEHYGINIDTAFNWKKRHGIDTIKEFSEVGVTKLNEGKPWTDREYLASMYDQYSTYELAIMWNCDPTTIQKWIKKHGIASKSYTEQWDRKSKQGARILKDDGFDLQEYLNTYREEGRLSKGIVEEIKEIVGACQACGFDEVLDLHHINENPLDNKPTNHIILCPNCHAKIHRLGKTVQELCPNYISWDTYAEAK